MFSLSISITKKLQNHINKEDHETNNFSTSEVTIETGALFNLLNIKTAQFPQSAEMFAKKNFLID